MAAKATPSHTDPAPPSHAPMAEQPVLISGPTGPSPAPQPSAPRNRTRAWVLRIAGTLLFLALLVWLDLSGALPLEKVWSALAAADFWLVALSIGFYAPFLVVKAARWRIVSASLGVPLSWGDACRIYGIGLAAGTFTPGQA
ncbi:MAG TPA: lysylphosphatidylglycerol synthase domain-containing protein, partial [Chloroflexia bacterium]|nr:lysylphosphatidylglycerol synthase domain-containing protein [Chloroflexia bacterium]